MKIFLPFQKELNPYLDEIIHESEHSWSYGNLADFDDSYDVVNIHWPEAMFDWKEPTKEELEKLEKHLLEWKKKSTVVYTKHDFQRNKGTTANFTKLFNLVEAHTNVFIHLGKFSRDFYREKYPRAFHTIIHHPLYINSFYRQNKDSAREKIGIPKDAFVIIVPGTIRSYAERDLILKAFDLVEIEKKVLICTNMHSELRFDFPGRIALKRWFDVKKRLKKHFKDRYQPPEFYFTYGLQSKENLEIKMSAADLVFIPRIKILNSGMLFLGLTFKKIVVGPLTGNITEHLEELKLPSFNPNQRKSVLMALRQGYEKVTSHAGYSSASLKKFMPNAVAEQIDELFHQLK